MKNIYTLKNLCIISGKSASGKSTLLFKILFNIINEFDKILIFSPSIHQPTYKTIIKCFNSFLLLNVIKNILKEQIPLDELDTTIEEIINNEDFESSHIECESYDNIDELKDPQEYESDIHTVIILDDLNKQQLQDPRVQMLFKRGRHNNLSIFVISHGFYELPKDTIRENSSIIHHFITNNFANVECIHRQLASTDMLIKEFKQFCHEVWNDDYNFITIDLTKKKNNGKYRKILNTLYLPSTNPFQWLEKSNFWFINDLLHTNQYRRPRKAQKYYQPTKGY